jgi:hypothetical protein
MSNHLFLLNPYIRTLDIGDDRYLKILIANQQGEDWYGKKDFIHVCDFLTEEKLDCFKGANNILDLGGHQFVWTIFYAGIIGAQVVVFEPSPLNTLIGIFNGLINKSLENITVYPFAIKSSTDKGDNEKMLIDFMNIEMQSYVLSECEFKNFDFIKVDIEGYEYEMLSDLNFVNFIKCAKKTHMELHLGHLIKRGVTLEKCINQLKSNNLNGKELWSQVNMYDFLNKADPHGFHAFILNN